MSGNASESGRSCRDCNTTPLRSQKARARKPSNFGSYTQPGPTGSRVTRAAAIGATGGTSPGGRCGGFGGFPTAAR
ncbi:hypothetical protein [Pseudonocardia charpentierae]|uniref:Uncharacterized protein n=1 Tax=Pseudonocardia charpentierae TaxID=3075545 RepID=A0ABU2NCF2_9PSEU|nr:hypothetical protein [Pseudonocardia sp. DSM 45834]MDT0351630.1 hypothetical protein [Pseudonocardia sp. DSM 45834]